jgi:hypothetical protein
MTKEEQLAQLRQELEAIIAAMRDEFAKPDGERDNHALYTLYVRHVDLLDEIATLEEEL